MCGISLIINKDFTKVDSALLSCFNNLIEHRGPDGEGFYYGNNIGIAHRRLAIIDLSTMGAQPMIFQNNLVISFNGEIFSGYNQLKWIAEVDNETSKIIIEKSVDGIKFEAIGTILGTDVLKANNSFNDYAPSIGNNFYRLAVISKSGEKEYSR